MNQRPDQSPPPLPSNGGGGGAATPEQVPSPNPAPEHAVLHVTQQTRTYPCPNCGSTLLFDADAQALLCPSCGTTAAISAEVARPASIAKRDLQSTMQQLAALQADASTQLSGDKETVCQNCGGHTLFSGTLTAVRCPYCNTPIQRDDVHEAPTRLPVDGVLPLRISQRNASERIEAWINSRRFAPNAFKKYREIGSFTSIYLPYFSYDAATTTRYTGRRGIHRTQHYTNSKGEQQTRIVTDWYPASGVVDNGFEDVTGHASHGLDDDKITALEPWPMDYSHPYSPQFTAGHLSRMYDLDASQVFGRRVQPRMESIIDHTIRSDIGGDEQQIFSRDIRWLMIRFSQLMLPVWMLTVTYKQKPFQVVINGVTGEVQGRRPWSAVKITLAVLAALIVIAVIYLVYVTYFEG
ncbi:MAG: hypothetical protein ACOX61_07740 [Brooklawnia sp.]|jgi:predicted RNA-binding Zn-ribbon protein involved in translation (DUF1610 family)